MHAQMFSLPIQREITALEERERERERERELVRERVEQSSIWL